MHKNKDRRAKYILDLLGVPIVCDGYGTTVRKPVSRYRTETIISVVFGSVAYFGTDQGETARARVGERLNSVTSSFSVPGIGPS